MSNAKKTLKDWIRDAQERHAAKEQERRLETMLREQFTEQMESAIYTLLVNELGLELADGAVIDLKITRSTAGYYLLQQASATFGVQFRGGYLITAQIGKPDGKIDLWISDPAEPLEIRSFYCASIDLARRYDNLPDQLLAIIEYDQREQPETESEGEGEKGEPIPW